MNKINEIINLLDEVSKDPKLTVKKYKEKTGKGVVGVMPLYAPEEIIHAAGFLPMGLWGAQKEVSKARIYLPPFACSIMQTNMELQIEGAYDDLDAVVFSVPCDTLKCMSQKWKGKSPVIVFTHPQNRKLESANKFLVTEYEILKDKLEKILNVKISDESITNSIEIYNENRKVMREFSDLAGQYPNIIDPIQRHIVFKSRWFMEKSEHTKLVKELISEIKKLPIEEWDGYKVIATGIMIEPEEILQIFKDKKIAIVADDLAQESRQFRHDVPEGDQPILRLAKWWQNLEGCALATDTKKLRGQMLIDMAKKYNADAVLICMMKFCDPEEFDYPVYYREFQEAGIKNLLIEIDLEMTAFEQTNTRLQTLVETL